MRTILHLLSEAQMRGECPALVIGGYALRNNLCARYIHDDLLHFPVDIVLVDSSTWDKFWPHSETAMVEGASLRVPSPAHMIALKLHALKQNPGQRDQDFSDIVRIAHSRAAQIPHDDLRLLCERYGPHGIFEQIRTALSQAN